MKRYELAQMHLRVAENCYAWGNEEEMWNNLIKWAALDYSPPRTARQKEVQRLWQQRGLLERTKANLANVTDIAAINNMPFSAGILREAWNIINNLIKDNQQQMATIRERIPDDRQR